MISSWFVSTVCRTDTCKRKEADGEKRTRLRGKNVDLILIEAGDTALLYLLNIPHPRRSPGKEESARDRERGGKEGRKKRGRRREHSWLAARDTDQPQRKNQQKNAHFVETLDF